MSNTTAGQSPPPPSSSRQDTPSFRVPSSQNNISALPAVPPPPPPSEDALPRAPRRSSFGFLRRAKSTERLNNPRRTPSGGKLTKRSAAATAKGGPQPAIPDTPPKIPDLAKVSSLQTFGGDSSNRTGNISKSSPGEAGRGEVGGGYYARHDGSGDARGGMPQYLDNDGRNRAPGAAYGVPLPGVPLPPDAPSTAAVDPYARTESMRNRGRYSYASSAVSTVSGPRRIRKRNDPTPFNVLVVGARNCGKTSFIDFLRASLALPARNKQAASHHSYALHPNRAHQQRPDTREGGGGGDPHVHGSDFSPPKHSSAFSSHYLEAETDDGERIGLTLWDSEGLDRAAADLQLREIGAFLEARFEETFAEETKVVRSPNARDTHIHCVILLLDPLRLDQTVAAFHRARDSCETNAANGAAANGRSYLLDPSSPGSVLGGLDEELDLQTIRALQGKTTVIPVVSKADTVTTAHMGVLKRAVYDSLKQARLDPFDPQSILEDDDDDNEDREIGADNEIDSSEDAAAAAASATAVALDGGNSLDKRNKRKKGHSRHDSRRFDERDEDALLQKPLDGRLGGNGSDSKNASRSAFATPTSHLVSSSSSSVSELAELSLSSSSSSTSSSPESKNAASRAATTTTTTLAAAPARNKGQQQNQNNNHHHHHQNTSSGENNNALPPLPLSVLTPDPAGTLHVPVPGAVARRFPWGAADPYDTAHCDFVRLREAVFVEWRRELREASREVYYEGWRTERLRRHMLAIGGTGGAGGSGAEAGAGGGGRGGGRNSGLALKQTRASAQEARAPANPAATRGATPGLGDFGAVLSPGGAATAAAAAATAAGMRESGNVVVDRPDHYIGALDSGARAGRAGAGAGAAAARPFSPVVVLAGAHGEVAARNGGVNVGQNQAPPEGRDDHGDLHVVPAALTQPHMRHHAGSQHHAVVPPAKARIVESVAAPSAPRGGYVSPHLQQQQYHYQHQQHLLQQQQQQQQYMAYSPVAAQGYAQSGGNGGYSPSIVQQQRSPPRSATAPVASGSVQDAVGMAR